MHIYTQFPLNCKNPIITFGRSIFFTSPNLRAPKGHSSGSETIIKPTALSKLSENSRRKHGKNQYEEKRFPDVHRKTRRTSPRRYRSISEKRKIRRKRPSFE